MDSDHTTTIIDTAIDRLAAALDQGNSEELARFLSAMARFHRYSWGNVMLIVSQRPSATHVAGFRAWQALGRHVRKGEKGIVIRAPVPRRVKPDEPDAPPLLWFKAAHVFDIEQTDGSPLPTLTRACGDPREHTERLRVLVAERGISLEYTEAIGTARGVSCGGSIKVRPSLPAAEEFAVLAHELAHELLHRGKDRSENETIRETEAEAVAYVVSQAVGLEVERAAADYIRLYGGDRDVLIDSLTRVQRVAGEILRGLLPEQSPEGEARPGTSWKRCYGSSPAA